MTYWPKDGNWIATGHQRGEGDFRKALEVAGRLAGAKSGELAPT
jgi:hypothetical protein